MSSNPTPVLPPEQISAAFAEVFKHIAPPEETKASAAERLKPYRPEILKLRRRGCSWKDIAKGMKDPRINVSTSPNTLQDLFETKRERTDRKARILHRSKPTVAPAATAGTPANAAKLTQGSTSA